MGLGERTGGALPGAGGQEADELQQLLVGIRHRRTADQGAVHQLQPHPVVSQDDDVLHPVVIHQRLQPAQPEQRVEHRLRQRLLLGPRPRRTPRGHLLLRRRIKQVGDDRPPQLLTGRPGGCLPHTVAERLGSLPTESCDELPVDHCGGAGNDCGR